MAKKLKTESGRECRNEVVKKMVRLHEMNPNMTYEDIGNAVGRDKSTVWRALKRYNIDKKKTQRFKEDRADIFAGTQANLIEAMNDPEKIAKASMRDLTIAAGTLYDKERLERGKSTEIHVFADLTEAVNREIREELKKAIQVNAEVE